jgi:serine/threonine-protein kinase
MVLSLYAEYITEVHYLKEDGEKKKAAKKRGWTSWLRSKFLGRDRQTSAVDAKFLTDLSDTKAIGRYEIIGQLGKGSMGVVYLGKDPYINRNVSIKVSRPSKVDGDMADRYRERFFLEAQSAGQLMHPNIVAIYDAGMYRDFCYIAMEHIDGPTLEKYCDHDELLPISKVVETIFTACQALDYAHKKGVIHRDLKPSNIMFNEAGEVKITDFGIAQVKTEHTISTSLIGSPSYMSPEQVKEELVEDKSDIFSLGCVLYELLTGEKAFIGENYFSILYKITHGDPVPVERIRPEVPEILGKITEKALSKDPQGRYQTCMDFAYDLRVALRGLKGTVSSSKVEDVVDYIRTVPFFEEFPRNHVKEIMNVSNIVKFRKGKVVVAEGEIDDSFFIILSGKAQVQKNKRLLAHIGRGECFGEMSYLSGQSRSATVISATDCILMKISATLLDRASESMQVLFLKKFAITMLTRLSKKND